MRIDFHFYTIYALARAAGLNPDDAYIIAYASQYTDDEANPETIDFEDGTSFKPRITAHSLYTFETISPRICKGVWVPFHFVPGNQGENGDRMITKPKGDLIEGIIKEFLDGFVSVAYVSHLLGIILHVLADTFSHQNFIGLISGKNIVNEIAIEGEPNDIVEKLITECKGLNNYIPNLGHAEAASFPDEPNRKWDYIDYTEKTLNIVNIDRTILAASSCYELLLDFLERAPNLGEKPPLTWEQISKPISMVFATKGNLEECNEAWKTTIKNGQIGFTPEGRDFDLKYYKKEWFNTAIETESPETSEGEGSSHYVHYQKKPNFDQSNLNLFNDAAGTYYSWLFTKTAEKLELEQVKI